MNDTNFINELKNKRQEYGISQQKLATFTGITREYLNRIENGKTEASEELKKELLKQLNRFNPETPLFLLIDYFRVRFPTTDAMDIIKNVLHIKFDYMLHEDYAFYGYDEQYVVGDITVMVSQDTSRGVLLELKGKGCRQMESYLIAQGRSWYDFILDCMTNQGVMKRLDLAINDRVGMLNIPTLIEKCENKECISYFRSYKSYRSSQMKHDDEKKYTGNTLYIGSLQSELYFCVYEKNYEQYIKTGADMVEAEIKNRFEIRLKNERAYHAVVDLLTYQDAERTAFSIINHYVRFVDKEENKPQSQWKLNADWAWFIGENREKIKLTQQPQPCTFQRTVHWLDRQVSRSLKMVHEHDKQNHTTILKDMITNAELTEKQEHLLKIEKTKIDDMIDTAISTDENNGIF